MPLGSPILRQLVTEIRYIPTILYHDQRISVCYRLTQPFPYWTLDMGKVEMYDMLRREDSKRLFTVTNRGASILQKNLGDYEGFRTLAERVFTEVTEGFRIQTINRIGIRFFYIASYDRSFETLKEVLCRKIYTQSVIESLTPNPTDLAFVVSFEEHNTKFNLGFGPVTKDELRARLAEPEAEFFDVGLMVDLDCFLMDIPLHRIHSFLRESQRYSQGILERVIHFSEE